jgi:hypothetical protein
VCHTVTPYAVAWSVGDASATPAAAGRAPAAAMAAMAAVSPWYSWSSR